MNDIAASKPVGNGLGRSVVQFSAPDILSASNGVKVKICGLTRLQDITAVNAALPDFIGFVFAESRRKVSEEQASLLRARLDSRIKAVGVFVNAPVKQVARFCEKRVIDMAQLHGDEDEGYIHALKQLTVAPIIKAVRVRSAEDVLAAQKLPCNYLLLDTYTANAYGGSGETFDYAHIPPLEKPFFLAGGLNLQSLPAALALNPYGVDISSGAETGGVKDGIKIAALVSMVRGHG